MHSHLLGTFSCFPHRDAWRHLETVSQDKPLFLGFSQVVDHSDVKVTNTNGKVVYEIVNQFTGSSGFSFIQAWNYLLIFSDLCHSMHI